MFSNEIYHSIAARAALGDVTAMLQLAQWYRGKLPQDYLALEAAPEKTPAEDAAALQQYRKEFPDGFVNAQACAMWYFRASIYGSREAEEFLIGHPGCVRIFRKTERMLLIGADVSQSFSGEELRRMGLLNFSENQTYSISSLSQEGFFFAKTYSGSEGPDERGFGRAEEYNFYCYDEFFNLLGSLRGYSNAEYGASEERFLKACREKLAFFAQQREAYWNSPDVPGDAVRYNMLLTQRQHPIIRGNRLVRYYGTQKEYTVPEQITVIGENAFSGNSELECLIVPEQVVKLEAGAFSNCSALKKLVLPDHLETVGDSLCFNSRALTDVHLPSGLRAIPGSMFGFDTSLKKIDFPPNLQTIGSRAFLCCPIEELVFPESITAVGDSAFRESKISTVFVPGTAVLGESAFQRCAKLTKVILGHGITNIPRECFAGCSALELVCLPDTLKTIERCAFERASNLKKMRIPPSVTYIGYAVFPKSLILHGKEESYAESYARKFGLTFLADDPGLDGGSQLT